jgi:NIMA (never in mitosis gene a)-related kinase 1/4/5
MQQHFVIKQINTTRMSRKERAEVENEVAVLSRLKCPNIVAYVDSFHYRGAFCIVMEYADGGDLESAIKARRGKLIPESQVLDWFIQICLALKYIHNRKILHRDLKPANIMLSRGGVIKLGDFGIAKVLSNTADLARTAIGTPYYLSPEICREEKYNNKSDIWSLGCILYEMCSLRHAFEARNMKELVKAIMRGRVAPLPSGYSGGVSELVTACLQLDPRKRPRVDRILQHPILQARIDTHLADDAARAEMEHTVIHGLRPMKDLPRVRSKSSLDSGGKDSSSVASASRAAPSLRPAGSHRSSRPSSVVSRRSSLEERAAAYREQQRRAEEKLRQAAVARKAAMERFRAEEKARRDRANAAALARAQERRRSEEQRRKQAAEAARERAKAKEKELEAARARAAARVAAERSALKAAKERALAKQRAAAQRLSSARSSRSRDSVSTGSSASSNRKASVHRPPSIRSKLEGEAAAARRAKVASAARAKLPEWEAQLQGVLHRHGAKPSSYSGARAHHRPSSRSSDDGRKPPVPVQHKPKPSFAAAPRPDLREHINKLRMEQQRKPGMQPLDPPVALPKSRYAARPALDMGAMGLSKEPSRPTVGAGKPLAAKPPPSASPTPQPVKTSPVISPAMKRNPKHGFVPAPKLPDRTSDPVAALMRSIQEVEAAQEGVPRVHRPPLLEQDELELTLSPSPPRATQQHRAAAPRSLDLQSKEESSIDLSDDDDDDEDPEVVKADVTMRQAREDIDRARLMASMARVSGAARPAPSAGAKAAPARAEEDDDDEDDAPARGAMGDDEEWVDSDGEDGPSEPALGAVDSAATEDDADVDYSGPHIKGDVAYIRKVLVDAVGEPTLRQACMHLATLDMVQGFERARKSLGRDFEHLLPLVQRIVVSAQAHRNR